MTLSSQNLHMPFVNRLDDIIIKKYKTNVSIWKQFVRNLFTLHSRIHAKQCFETFISSESRRTDDERWRMNWTSSLHDSAKFLSN